MGGKASSKESLSAWGRVGLALRSGAERKGEHLLADIQQRVVGLGLNSKGLWWAWMGGEHVKMSLQRGREMWSVMLRALLPSWSLGETHLMGWSFTTAATGEQCEQEGTRGWSSVREWLQLQGWDAEEDVVLFLPSPCPIVSFPGTHKILLCRSQLSFSPLFGCLSFLCLEPSPPVPTPSAVGTCPYWVKFASFFAISPYLGPICWAKQL